MNRLCVYTSWCLAAVFLTSASPDVAAPDPAVQPLHVTGTVVTPDYKPCADATVTFFLLGIRDGKRTVLFSQTVKPVDGTFDIVVPPDALKPAAADNSIIVASVTYVSAPEGLAVSQPQVLAQAGTGAPRIVLHPPTSIRLRLMDGPDVPAVGVQISPQSFSEDRTYGAWDEGAGTQWTRRTDAQGYVTLAGLPQGASMRLAVDDERYAELSWKDAVHLANAPTSPDQTITLGLGSTVTGVVRYGVSGKPAAGMMVEAFPTAPPDAMSGGSQTDEEGGYHIPRLAAGLYSLEIYDRHATPEAATTDWTAVARPLKVVGGVEAAKTDFNLIHGGLLTGIVTDKVTGRPLAGVMVSVAGPAHPTHNGLTATTGPDGKYRLSAAPGRQVVSVYSPGVPEDPAARVYTVADGETKAADFAVSAPILPRSVGGIVLGPDGKPVAGAEVLATNENTQERKEYTDAQGRFAFGEMGLMPKARVFARSGDLATPVGLAASADGVTTLHLSPSAFCSIGGRVRDGHGRPLSDAAVALIRWQDNMGTDVDTVKTDAEGRYAFVREYGDARYCVRADKPGYGSKYTDQVQAIAGKTLEVPALLAPEADSFVAGLIVDPQGKPVAGAVVTDNEVLSATSTTDVHGRFRLNGIPGGKVAVQVNAPADRQASIMVAAGRSDNVIKVMSRAEQEAESRHFVAERDADPTNHGNGEPAEALLRTAQVRAGASGRKVILVFHASWCGPCFVLHRFLEDPQVRPVMAAHFVVQDLDIWEKGKNAWENPGGTALYKKYGGPNSVPYFVVLDGTGKKLGDSVRVGENMGMPSAPPDVAFFLQLLKRAAPSFSPREAATLKAGLQRANTF